MRRAVLLTFLLPALAFAQADRRGRSSPGLVLNTGARTGACDVLFFSANGRELLAAGDDKVVLTVPLIDGKDGLALDPTATRSLRWPIWREQRGAIYTAAQSPDQSQVAVAGFGVKTGAVAVLDRATGKLLHLLDDKLQDQTIWAIAFTSDGNGVAFGAMDGSIWLWNLAGPKNDVTRLVPPNDKPNAVRLLSFRDATHLLAVTADGAVREYDTANPATPTEIYRLTIRHLRVAALSPDRRWLAAVSEFDSPQGWLEVADLQANPKQSSRPENPLQTPNAQVQFTLLALRRIQSRQRHVGGRLPQRADGSPTSPRLQGQPRQRRLQPDPWPAAGEGRGRDTIELNNYPESLAFHPTDPNLLATAGGDNHALILWDVPTRRPHGVVRGPGAGVWGVAFSTDGLAVGFQQQRKPDPATPNDRGTGPVRIFDLNTADLRPTTTGFQPVRPVETFEGWSVKPGWGAWAVVDPTGRETPLVDKQLFDLPMCYTFVKPSAGGPPRLAIGHYWGASLYELRPTGPKLVRHFIGHGGEVTSLGIDPNREKLVTGSRDQTIALWSLADWPSQPELGAAFQVQGGKLVVTAVDPGSPAWETGLEAGDEVVGLHLTHSKDAFTYTADGRDLRVKHGIRVPANAKVGDAAEASRRLRDEVVPNDEIQFVLNQGGKDRHTRMTTVQRPIVRLVAFRPEYPDEFLAYRWRDYVYHAKGAEVDRSIGWHVNPAADDADGTPSFQPLGTLYKTLHSVDKLRMTLRRFSGDASLVQLGEWEQPKASVTVPREFTGRGNVPLVLSAKPVSEGPLQKVTRAELWVDDQRHAAFDLPRDGILQESLTLDRAKLPGNAFRVQVRAINAAGIEGRSEELPIVLPTNTLVPRKKGKLHVLCIGVSTYKQFPMPGGALPDLPRAVKDAKALAKALNAQRGRHLYEGGETIILTEEQVTPDRVIQSIDAIDNRTSGGNDLAVLFLAGHGVAAAKDGSFQFVGFGGRRLDGGDLSRAWAGVKCHKLALLDTHHAGKLTLEGSAVRALSEGMPMLIYAASQPDEQAADDGEHGLFTRALLDALGDKFRQASAQQTVMTSDALMNYVDQKVPEMFQRLKQRRPDLLGGQVNQRPVVFRRPPRELDLFAEP
ncbi:MAG: caspase family protein [Gemmataceae bacterium]